MGLEQCFSTFQGLCTPSKDSQHLWPSVHQQGFAISRQSYLEKASVCGPRRTILWPPRGAEGSDWETLT